MSTSITFVPRQVSRPIRGSETSKPQALPSSASTLESIYTNAKTSEVVAAEDKAVHRPFHDTTKDIATITLLALSDYRIWSDADLREKLDICLNNSNASTAGFVPVNYLIRRPPFRGVLSTDISEIDVVKAVRAYAKGLLEIRMLVSSTSSSVWCGSGKTSRKKDIGGYEVRRVDWATLLNHPLRALGAAQWNDRMLYMERVPVQYRSVAGIARFARALVPTSVASTSSLYVQCVTLPPHYLDCPGDIPRCRGYALVTFSTTEQRNAILEQWPWRRRFATKINEQDVGHTSEIKDALMFGFRTISKARWDELNEVYLTYRQSLMDKVVEADSSTSHGPDVARGLDGLTQPKDDSVTCSPSAETPAVPQTISTSPYPFGCLVFVRNTHPDTNKTTLKALFAKAFEAQGQSNGLDYVDFSKGMDSCYLRLASPRHAGVLTEHFGRRLTVQTGGLDDTGRPPALHEREIKIEVIHGKREELYWEKIPDKVRHEAVVKVVRTQQSTGFNCPLFSSPCKTARGKKRKRL